MVTDEDEGGEARTCGRGMVVHSRVCTPVA